MKSWRGTAVLLVLACLALAGCGGDAPGSGTSSITLYTCVGDPTAKAVIAAFTKDRPGTRVDLFRAPTGQLNARVAGDTRAGGLQADVLWTCDPLTMNGFARQGLLRRWSPPNVADIPARYRTADFAAVDLLYLVAVVRNEVIPCMTPPAVCKGRPVPKTWHDLTGPAYRGAVALPDPAFAASALGMLGYFSSADGYGLDYYRALKANGAVQLKSPDDVLTGVAQGTYRAGFTLANAAYLAKKKGSPIQVVWPLPGAVAIYAPIAVTKRAGDQPLADQFAAYVASRAGQQVVAKTNVYPVLPGVGGPEVPSGAPVVAPDWTALFGSSAELSAQYRTIFGG
jgi:iron(III) transport system substrate-binding protein